MDRLRRRPDATPARRRRLAREASPGEPPRRQIGPYRLFGKIGSGPHGRVYLAIDDRTRTKVAVKVLRERNKENVEALVRELKLPMVVKHPGLVPVLDAGWYRDRAYVAMEHVEAGTAQEFQLTYEQAARILIKVADAVHAAHEKGVLHRNIKPANIFLDENGEPRLADFAPASRPPASPEFLAPEQAAGNLKAVARTTDVYALGATLYTLLTQHPPFAGESPEAIRRRILEAELVPPGRLDRAMPPAIEAIVLRAMARDPARRYATAAQFAADLRNHLEHLPVAALAERARRRVAVASSAAAVALIAAAGAWLAWRGPQPAPESPEPAAVTATPEPPPPVKPADQTPHPPPEQRPPSQTPEPAPSPPVDRPPEKPAIPAAVLAELRDRVLASHRHYLETYLLPEERARAEDLARSGAADAEDLAFLRTRVIGEAGAAIRADQETIEALAAEGSAHAAALKSDPGNAEARAALGFVRSPSGFWRRELSVSATPEGIVFEGRTYTRQALRSHLPARGFVHLNGTWCRRRSWRFVPAVHGKERRASLAGADTFTLYDSRLETIYDAFSKINVQVKRFTPRAQYFGALDGEVAVTVEAPFDFVEAQVRAASAVVGEGGVEVWLRVDATGERSKLYELTAGKDDELRDVTALVRGRGAFTLIARLRSRDEGRDRRAARFLPSDAADGAPLEVRATVGEPDPALTKLLGAEAPGPSPEEARRLIAEAADRLVGEGTPLAEACEKVRAEAVMLKYEPAIETPLEFEGLARAIGDPLAFDPARPDPRLTAWWDEQTLPKRRAFAAWFGLWCARERTRR